MSESFPIESAPNESGPNKSGASESGPNKSGPNESGARKRSWNAFVWTGFGVALLAALSYFLFFLRFPATRDDPWVNWLLFLAAGAFLAIGLKRAFCQPERYRGKVSGVILSTLGVLVFGLFSYMVFVLSKDLPSGSGAPRAGRQAPGFTLASAGGGPVALSELLKNNRAVLLIFYRGYW